MRKIILSSLNAPGSVTFKALLIVVFAFSFTMKGLADYTASNGLQPLHSNPGLRLTIGSIVITNDSSCQTAYSFAQFNKAGGLTGEWDGQARQPQPPPTIYTNLMTYADGTLVTVDGVAAAFGRKYSAGIDNYDAAKMWNFDENMALMRDGTALAIEFRPIPVTTDTLFYKLYLRQQPYTFKIYTQNFPSNVSAKAWVVDKYLKTKTRINLKDTTLYSFTPNTDTNSYRNRFMLVFSSGKTTTVNNSAVQQKPGDMITGKTETYIYPNPVIGKNFNLVMNNLAKDKYILKIYNVAGQLLSTNSINYEGGRHEYNVKLPDNIGAGNYVLQILNSDNMTVNSISVIVK